MLATLLPGLALAEVVWKADFESGNLQEWDKTQSMSEDRLAVVEDPARQGRYALRTTVIQGDDPIDASGNRNEVVKITDEKPGSEYFYSWSTMFPADYPSENKWQLFTQWHQAGCCGSPPLEFFVNGEQMHLRVGGSGGKILWTAPLTRAAWNDFVLHVKWSESPTEGFVELWHNGQPVVQKTHLATQFDKTGQYLKLGLYRDESIAAVGEVFHDNFIMGTTMEDVVPAAAPAEPAPTEPVASAPEAPAAPAPGGGLGITEAPFDVAGEEPGAGTPGTGAPAGCAATGASGLSMAALLGGLGLFTAALRRRKLARARP